MDILNQALILFSPKASAATWQLWLLFFVAVIVIFVLRKIAIRPLAGALLRRNPRKKKNPLYIVIFAVTYLLHWVLLYILCVVFGQLVGFEGQALELWRRILNLLIIVSIYTYLQSIIKYHLEDILHFLIEMRGEEELIRSIRPLLRAGLSTLFFLTYVLSIMSFVLGLNISSWLAGLGIFGLGISLAMQDTFSNLIATIGIAVTKPFKEGDRIVFSGFDGMVENIGLRSSSIRTLSGHLVSVPNSELMNRPVENIAKRPYIKRVMEMGITYDTPKEKILEAVELVKDVLAENADNACLYRDPDLTPKVYFKDFGSSELVILALYWYQPPDYWNYMSHAQVVNEKIFKAFDAASIDFAFPSQTLYLAGDEKRKLALNVLGQDLERKQGEKSQNTVVK